MNMSRFTLCVALILSWLICIPSLAAQTHLVRNGETLWSISRKYGVSVKSIVRANHLSRPNSLDIGQKLSIPDKIKKRVVSKKKRVSSSSSNSGTWRFKYDARTLNKLLRVQTRKKNKWRYIVIHHSATENGSAKAFEYYHRQKRHMKNGMAYHFVLGNGHGSQNGKIEVGDRWKKQLSGGHSSNQRMNEVGIGVCLVGNFQKNRPTSRQLQSLADLVRHLQKEFGIPRSRVIVHNEVKQKSTLCPGKYFPTDKFRRML